MEFENDQPTDDEQRRLAKVKKIVLQPLHGDITPDAIPDAEISMTSSSHDTAPNTATESEDTSTKQLVQPTKSALNKTPVSTSNSTPSSGRLAFTALVVMVFVLIISATIWLWLKAA